MMAQRVESLVNGVDSQLCSSLHSALAVSSTPAQSVRGETIYIIALDISCQWKYAMDGRMDEWIDGWIDMFIIIFKDEQRRR